MKLSYAGELLGPVVESTKTSSISASFEVASIVGRGLWAWQLSDAWAQYECEP